MKVLVSRGLKESDYDKMVKWGEFWRFPIPPREFLPNDGLCGIAIVSGNGGEDEEVLCTGLIYETNSKACWVEYIISNPNEKDKEVRTAALNFLIQSLSQVAKEWGYKWIFTSVKNQNLINRYSENGFVVGTQGTTEMIKAL
jgi:hypothetical protein